MKNPKGKAGFILMLSCFLLINLCTAGTVLAEETTSSAEEAASSAAETASSAAETASSAAETAESVSESSAAENDAAAEDDIRRELLTALDNPVYVETLAVLKGGEKITEGTTSDAARGLQQALSDMGREIEIDGNAGPATFGTLNEMLKEFGMEETDSVDDALYADILSLVLLSRNEDGSYDDILAAYYDREDDDGLYRYLTGCMYFQSERYYKALEAFEESGYRDYEEKMKACEQPWPESGELWCNSEVYGQDMYLKFNI